MSKLQAGEVKLLDACQGSHDPYDRIWGDGSNLRSQSEQTFCSIQGVEGAFNGGVMGGPWCKFHLATAGVTSRQEGANLLLNGQASSLKLGMATGAPKLPKKSLSPKKFTCAAIDLRLMADVLTANAGNSLQVTRFEMLGMSIHQGSAYSLSLEALIQLKKTFDPNISLLIPTALIKMIGSALTLYQVKDDTAVEVLFSDELVWTTIGRAAMGASLPIYTAWLDISQIRDSLKEAQEGDFDLAPLRDHLALMTSTGSAVMQLGPVEARCTSTHASYAWEKPSAPLAVSVPFSKLSDLLPLTPRLKKAASRIIQLESDQLVSYLSTL